MKRFLLICILLGFNFGLGQNEDHNFIKITEYMSATANPDSTKITVQYFDGLGRASQIVEHKQSPTGNDIISHIEYDLYGRQYKEYLPYTPNRSSLDFDNNALNGTLTYYQNNYNTEIAYSEKELEASPLNRVLKQSAPGETWAMNNGHEIKFDYQTNTENQVHVFKANANFQSNLISLEQGGFYEQGQLYKNIIYDENFTGLLNRDSNTTPATETNNTPLTEFIGGLEANQTYQFKVKRICENGIESDWSEVYTIPLYTSTSICTTPNNKDLLWERIAPGVANFNSIDKESLYTVYANLPGRSPQNLGMNNLNVSYANESLVSRFAYDFKVKRICQDGSVSSWSNIYNIPQFSEESIDECASPIIDKIGWKRISNTEVAFDYIDESSQYFIKFIENRPSGLTSLDITGDDHSIEEFTNKEGQVILKRTYSNSVAHNTYYVYDIYGNLTYVIPPLVNLNTSISLDILDNLCYQYKYDHRNRLIEKKLPGKEWEYLLYDKQNRLVGTQDATLSEEQQWLFTKYDKFGRVAYTGKTNSSDNREILQEELEGYGANNIERVSSGFSQNGITVDYQESNTWPPTFSELYNIHYYDNYNFTHGEALTQPVEGITSINGIPTESTYGVTTKGLSTASFTRVLGTDTWEKTLVYYDSKSRPIKTYKQNHLGGFTTVDSKLDFRGKTLYDVTYHKKSTIDIQTVIKNNYTYDSSERFLKQTQEIEGHAEELLVKNKYNPMGQLNSKIVGGQDLTGNTGLQQIDYSYNIRGWMTSINNIENLTSTNQPRDLFAFDITYDMIEADDMSGVDPLYNGNISRTRWRTDTDNQVRGYTYTYDALNRLRKSFYQKNNIYKGLLDEHLTYDKNGNITTLKRWGTPEQQEQPRLPDIDHLLYKYYPNSNQLKSVNDFTNSSEGFVDGEENSEEYVYDDNGNMISDKNKGILAITYNHMNLPTKIKFNDGEAKKIEYLYNAIGIKLQKQVTDGTNITTTQYLDGFQYVENVLQFFPTPEGYVSHGDNGFYYVYNYTDHLGNIRLSYKDNDGNLETLEESNYYPFGLKHNYNNYPQGNIDNGYKYKFNGKELQDELDLNVYDFNARNYMPDLGRTTTFDPNMENYYSLSPNSFFGNNPLTFTDPSGKDILFWQYDEKNKEWNRVTLDKLDQSTQQAIQDFAGTKLGYEYLQQFADSDGQQFGDVMIEGVLTDKVADLYITEGGFSSNSRTFMRSGTKITNNNKIIKSIQVNINKTKNRSRVDNAVTFGHEAFIHGYSNGGEDLRGLIISALMFRMHPSKRNLENFDRAEAEYYKAFTEYINNPILKNSENSEHQFIRQNLDHSLNTYIQQLRYVLNPTEVNAAHQRHDNMYKNNKGL